MERSDGRGAKADSRLKGMFPIACIRSSRRYYPATGGETPTMKKNSGKKPDKPTATPARQPRTKTAQEKTSPSKKAAAPAAPATPFAPDAASPLSKERESERVSSTQ